MNEFIKKITFGLLRKAVVGYVGKENCKVFCQLNFYELKKHVMIMIKLFN